MPSQSDNETLAAAPGGMGDESCHTVGPLRAKGNPSKLFVRPPIWEMHVTPREPDLFLDSNSVFLRPNKLIGKYSSCDDYLDIHFRLLLEDFLRPLRDSVNTLQKLEFPIRGDPIKFESLYYDVLIKGGNCDNVDYDEVLQAKGTGRVLVPIIRNNLHEIDWEDSKIFMNGSLLLLTQDNFKTINFAEIRFRAKDEQKSQPNFVELSVHFSNDGRSWKVSDSDRYLMLESSAFFAAYKYTLEFMQEVNLNLFPMKKYIVDAVTTARPPRYLRWGADGRKIDFSALMGKNEIMKLLRVNCASPLDFKSWPTASQLNLDESQYEAFQKALTQEMTIIQGPPGTGKTFIGVQIVKLLLTNPWLLDSPILVVSFTNHALDQTLEKILPFVTENICGRDQKLAQQAVLRIGGGTKSKIVKPLTLMFKREKFGEKVRLQHVINANQNALKKLEGYLDFKNLLHTTKGGVLDFGKLPRVITRQLSANNNSRVVFETWEKVQEDIKKNPKKWFGIQENYSDTKENAPGKDSLLLFGSSRKLEEKISSMTPRLLKSLLEREFFNKVDLNDYDHFTRWAFYFFLLSEVHNIVSEMKSQIGVLQFDQNELDHFKNERESIRAAKVIGMTTTGAVKYKNTVVHLTKPKIMIVEEAAHVLEAHVVASLTEHCQQLILIGDHRQLRPMTADDELGKKYQLNVSLMERLVRNGMAQRRTNWIQLQVQRRMRPEIARLVCPVIYERLENHSAVYEYPNVRGCKKNLFFVDHWNEEEQEPGSCSYFNNYEADLMAGLVKYFVNGGYYQSTQITVIVTYLAQKLLLESKLKGRMGTKWVRVSTVDGFQGEENDIILLSLVRSNNENRVGFLKTNNRVCVALSRARHGLFMVGNMSCLKAASGTWASINDILEDMNSIGNNLPLEDPKLFERSINTKVPRQTYVENFKNLKLAPVKLPCGHPQVLTPRQMNNIVATKCIFVVSRTLACGHEHKMPCHLDKRHFMCDKISCRKIAKAFLPSTAIRKNLESTFSHAPKATGNSSTAYEHFCGKIFKCGHACRFISHPNDPQKHQYYQCLERCTRSCPVGHPCPGDHPCCDNCGVHKGNGCKEPFCSVSPIFGKI